jgi:hypothetical protein
MNIFSVFFYPAVWCGEEANEAAQALEFSLYRYRIAPSGVWKAVYRNTVRLCVRDLRAELAIRKSGQAQAFRFFMSGRKRGMRWS